MHSQRQAISNFSGWKREKATTEVWVLVTVAMEQADFFEPVVEGYLFFPWPTNVSNPEARLQKA